MKILYNDTETTGTDPKIHTITQIAAIVEINGKVVGEFESKVRPLPGKEITDKALEVTGFTREQLMTFPNPWDVYQEFNKFLSQWSDGRKENRYVMAGYNAPFDCDMFFNWYLSLTNNKFVFWKYLQFSPIDPLPAIRMLNYMGLLPLEDNELGTVAKHFNIELQAHDALSDIRATRQIIHIVRDIMRAGFKEWKGSLTI